MKEIPLMEQVIRLNDSTNGRDKVLRLLQFTSRIMWASASKSGNNEVKWKALEESLSATRKAMQLFRFVDIMYNAKTTVKLEDSTHRVTLTMSKIALSLYYMTDNVVYAARLGLLDVDRNKWFKLSYRFWLYSIIMNLLRDLYEIQKVLEDLERRRSHVDLVGDLVEVCQEKPAIAVDIIRNTCDILIPLSSLNHLPRPLSPRMIGILGAISSICSILQLTNPRFRLSPS